MASGAKSADFKRRGQRELVFLRALAHSVVCLARDWSNAGTRLREYMAGPIAQFTMYQKNAPARDRYQKAAAFHYGDGINFGFVRVDPGAERATLEFVGAEGKTLFSADLRP